MNNHTRLHVIERFARNLRRANETSNNHQTPRKYLPTTTHTRNVIHVPFCKLRKSFLEMFNIHVTYVFIFYYNFYFLLFLTVDDG